MLLFACCMHKKIDLIEKNYGQYDTCIYNTYIFEEI